MLQNVTGIQERRTWMGQSWTGVVEGAPSERTLIGA
jgi:hypothetical protein